MTASHVAAWAVDAALVSLPLYLLGSWLMARFCAYDDTTPAAPVQSNVRVLPTQEQRRTG